MGAVVETGNVNHGGKAVLQDTSHLVHAASDRTCRVFAMADILQERGYLITFRTALGRHFIADAPHHDTGIVAILTQHVHHVTFCPFAEVAVIAVLAFGNVPLVERFQHHHKTHLIAKLHQLRRRHIMGSAHGIATHIFQQRKLTAQGSYIDRSPQRSEVVMIAYSLKLAMLAIQEEALIGYDFDATDAETGGIFIRQLAVGIDFGNRFI